MKTLDIILICFFFLFIIFGVLLMQYARSQGSLCTQDPLTFYENKHKETCSCFCSGELYVGNNYAKEFTQYKTDENNINLSFFNKSLGDLG